MTIDRIKGHFYAECDNCGETHEDENIHDFDEFRYAIDTHGWKTEKLADKWFHFCENCTGKPRPAQIDQG